MLEDRNPPEQPDQLNINGFYIFINQNELDCHSDPLFIMNPFRFLIIKPFEKRIIIV